jgi:hypothetical protein
MNTPKEDDLIETVKAMYVVNEASKPRPHADVTKIMDKEIEYFDASTYEDLLYRLALKTKSDSEEIEDPAFANAAKHLMQAWKAYSNRSGN